MDELQTQITEEIAAITDFLEQRLSRRSRWNGEVKLSADPDFHGKAHWNGSLSISRRLAATDLRWRTEIHEALHLFSAGLTPHAYLDFEGWEEGVVEHLQRALRSAILAAMPCVVSEDIFRETEVHHEYNKYLKALESLRFELNKPLLPFYQELLAAPLADRPAFVIQAGRQLPQEQFRRFQRVFAKEFSTLTGS